MSRPDMKLVTTFFEDEGNSTIPMALAMLGGEKRDKARKVLEKFVKDGTVMVEFNVDTGEARLLER